MAATPKLTTEARKAGGFYMAEGLTDAAQFLAWFGRRVLLGLPIAAADLGRAAGLIDMADAVAANDAKGSPVLVA